MISDKWLFLSQDLTMAACEIAERWQLGSQDAATPGLLFMYLRYMCAAVYYLSLWPYPSFLKEESFFYLVGFPRKRFRGRPRKEDKEFPFNI